MNPTLPLAFSLAAIVHAAAAPEEHRPAIPRHDDYRRAREKARGWFDRLVIDCADLQSHGVKGKKKLAEILDAYLSLYRNTSDPKEQKKVRERIEGLIEQTKRPAYHNLSAAPEKEFTENSMSYLRVAWLMKLFGLDIDGYLDEIRAVKPRLDEHLKKRGPWQRAMFAEYYDRFGLPKPEALRAAPLAQGVISRRLPADQFDDNAAYDLTHEVFVAFDYGFRKTPKDLAAGDLAYAREVLPRLIDRYRARNNSDLLAEFVSCMTYLGWHADEAYRRGIDYLLDHQNADGTWGDYERYRPTYGRYLDQEVYLHTTMVVMGALTEAYEGGWPAAR